MSPNKEGIESISFRFYGKRCIVRIKTDTAGYELVFGAGSWEMGETGLHGPNLLGQAIGHFAGLSTNRVAGSFAWRSRDSLELQLRFIESPHTERIVCTFEGPAIRAEFHNSFEGEAKKTVITGSAL